MDLSENVFTLKIYCEYNYPHCWLHHHQRPAPRPRRRVDLAVYQATSETPVVAQLGLGPGGLSPTQLANRKSSE